MMNSGAEILERLAEPFPADQVSWRVGSTNKRKWEAEGKREDFKRRGLPLAYIDARDVMERLDAVLGADWEDEILVATNGLVTCRISIYIGGKWVTRQDGTAAPAGARNDDDAEMQQKGAISDAFKRAAVKWGVGRYLYGIEAPWIELDKFWAIPDSEKPALRRLLERSGATPQSARASRPEFDEAKRALIAAHGVGRLAVDEVVRLWAPKVAKWPNSWVDGEGGWADLVARAQNSARHEVA